MPPATPGGHRAHRRKPPEQSIGYALDISEITARTHCAKMMRTMNPAVHFTTGITLRVDANFLAR
jgi:hypothetical protein